MISKKKVIVFAYGFMGKSILSNILNSKKFDVIGIILPKKNSIYTTNIKQNKIHKTIKVLNSDNSNIVHLFIKKLKPDIVIISTFNKILKAKTLNLSSFVNIHHGKLPRQKGRASINWALIMGRNNIYLTVHEVNSELDAGNIIKQIKFTISKKDNYITMQNKINKYLKFKFNKLLENYLENKFKLKKNLNSKETWNCSRNPEDGMINFFDKSKDIINLIQATKSRNFGAYCFLKNKKITILDAKKSNRKFEGIIPGRVTKINKDGTVECLCSDGAILISKILYKNKLQKPGKLIKSTRDTLLND